MSDSGGCRSMQRCACMGEMEAKFYKQPVMWERKHLSLKSWERSQFSSSSFHADSYPVFLS